MNTLAIGLPTLLVLVGILLNQRGMDKLEARIGKTDARIASLETTLRAELSALRGEITALRISMHNDVVMLLERDSKLDARVTRLEEAAKA